MSKKTNNSFAGAALSLCITEEELQKRLDAYLELNDVKVERDRAIEAAYHQNSRLRDFAAAVIQAILPLEGGSNLSKKKLIGLLQHAKNISTLEEAKTVELITESIKVDKSDKSEPADSQNNTENESN